MCLAFGKLKTQNVKDVHLLFRRNNLGVSLRSHEELGRDPENGDMVLTAFQGSWYRARVVDLKLEKVFGF